MSITDWTYDSDCEQWDYVLGDGQVTRQMDDFWAAWYEGQILDKFKDQQKAMYRVEMEHTIRTAIPEGL